MRVFPRADTSESTALQFKTFRDYIDIMTIFNAPLIYVPRGYDHQLREPYERDRSRGDIRDDAENFLIYIDPISNAKFRLDVGSWLLHKDNEPKNRFAFYSNEEFREMYVKID